MMDETQDSCDHKPRKPLSYERLYRDYSGGALERALRNTHQAADEAWRLLSEAMIESRTSKIQVLLSIHNKAVEALFTAESAYREELERRKILIPLAEAMEMARRGYTVILERLKTLPQNVAPLSNPADPERAITAIECECTGIVSAAQEIYAAWSKGGPNTSTAIDAE